MFHVDMLYRCGMFCFFYSGHCIQLLRFITSIRRWNLARINIIFSEENSPTITFLLKLNFANAFQISPVEKIPRNSYVKQLQYFYYEYKETTRSIYRNFRYTTVTPLIKVRDLRVEMRKCVITEIQSYIVLYAFMNRSQNILYFNSPLYLKKIKNEMSLSRQLRNNHQPRINFPICQQDP